MRWLCRLLFVLALSPTSGWSQPSGRVTKTLEDKVAHQLVLSLPDCFQRALKANLDLQVERVNPSLAAANLLGSEGLFDLRLHTQGQYGENTSPQTAEQIASNGFGSIQSRTTQMQGALLQTFPTGTQLGFVTNSQDNSYTFNEFNHEWNSFAGLSLVQPLFRNLGTDVNEAQIRIARQGVKAADDALRYRVEQVVSAVADAYYELIFTRNNLVASEESLHLAQQLLEDNKQRVQIGVMSPLDVAQANSEVAARNEEVIESRRAIRDQENVLRSLISADVASLLDKTIIPIDLPPQNWNPSPVTYNIVDSLKYRADYQRARELSEQGRLQENYQKNQLLPQINFLGQYGYAGREHDIDSSYNDISERTNRQWFIGLSVDFPIQNRVAESNYQSARERRIQQELLLKQVEQEIIIETDNTAGQAESSRERILAARTARSLAEETLQAEEKKLKAGVSTSYTVLQMQRDLAQARTNELRAIADFQKSSADLARVQGLALNYFDIHMEDR